MFSFFRNIRDITILVLGLDGAGKIALLQNLANGLSQVTIIIIEMYFNH